MNLTEKLFHIQQNLKAPKNQRNSFGDFSYRSCEDILEAAKPLLKEMKAVLLLSDEILLVGNRYYVEATATLKDVESDETISNKASAREADSKPKMDAAQVTGSSSSYARKYALNGLFCIDDSRDPDMMEPEGRGTGQAAGSSEKKQQQAPPRNRTGADTGSRENSSSRQTGSAGISDGTGAGQRFVGAEYISNIRAEMNRTGVTEQQLCQHSHIRSLNEITEEQYQYIMNRFSRTASKEQRAAG